MRKLTHREIDSAARGVTQVIESDGGIQLLRYTQAQMDYYIGKGDPVAKWAYLTPGTALDFVTDSQHLTLQASVTPPDGKSAFVDIYIDGQFTGYFGGEGIEGRIDETFRLHETSGAPKRITLYLYHSRAITIETLGLDAGARFDAAPTRPVMLVFGDSISRGGNTEHPSLAFACIAARELGFNLHNCGMGGQGFDPDSLPDRPVEIPRFIMTAYGVNDWGSNRGIDNARAFLARLRTLYPETPVVVLQPIWRHQTDDAENKKNELDMTLADYRTALTDVAREFSDMVTLPWDRLFPRGPAFFVDGVHPNAAGHIAYGLNLLRILRGVLPGMGVPVTPEAHEI